jgi:hypothetical protein
MEHEFDMLVVLSEIRELLKKQNEILEQQQQPQTKITVVGNKPLKQSPKGLKSDEDFSF